MGQGLHTKVAQVGYNAFTFNLPLTALAVVMNLSLCPDKTVLKQNYNRTEQITTRYNKSNQVTTQSLPSLWTSHRTAGAPALCAPVQPPRWQDACV